MMKNHRLAVVAAVIALLALAPAPELLAQDDADQIRTVREASNAAIASRDIDALRSTWIEDFNVTGSSGRVYAGDAEMTAGFQSSFEDPEFTTYVRTPETVQVSANGAFGAEEGAWVGTWDRADGTMRLRGTYLAQWQNRSGEWKLASEVFVALSCGGSTGCAEVLPNHRDTTAAKLQESHWSPDAMLVGEIEESDLREAPFDEWYVERYDAYSPDAAAVEGLGALDDETQIEVFFGTWCGDSKREVPRLMRSLDEAGFPRDRVRIVALSDHPGVFKMSPAGSEHAFLIHRTPTIVVHRDGDELGRIVERPAGQVEQDLAAIVAGDRPARPYGAESALHTMFYEGDTDAVQTPTSAFLEHLRELGDTESLWHYAYYDLLLNGRPADAADVLRVFLTLHPDSVRGHRFLASAHRELGEVGEALYAVRRALALDPEDRGSLRLERELLGEENN
ncbi:MAG: DUF4440 domain-containing protein [Acidobacteria bacterium]|nr:DUF4440 domain-containing protein [Acidobacteriota bacterium]